MDGLQVFTSIGLGAGDAMTDEGMLQVITLEFPTGIGEELELRHMTLGCAESLLNSLPQAIAAALQHAEGRDTYDDPTPLAPPEPPDYEP